MCLRGKAQFTKEARNWRPVLGTQTLFWRLTHPAIPTGGGGGALSDGLVGQNSEVVTVARTTIGWCRSMYGVSGKCTLHAAHGKSPAGKPHLNQAGFASEGLAIRRASNKLGGRKGIPSEHPFTPPSIRQSLMMGQCTLGANTRHGRCRQVSQNFRQVSAGVRQFGRGTWKHTHAGPAGVGRCHKQLRQVLAPSMGQSAQSRSACRNLTLCVPYGFMGKAIEHPPNPMALGWGACEA